MAQVTINGMDLAVRDRYFDGIALVEVAAIMYGTVKRTGVQYNLITYTDGQMNGYSTAEPCYVTIVGVPAEDVAEILGNS